MTLRYTRRHNHNEKVVSAMLLIITFLAVPAFVILVTLTWFPPQHNPFNKWLNTTAIVLVLSMSTLYLSWSYNETAQYFTEKQKVTEKQKAAQIAEYNTQLTKYLSEQTPRRTDDIIITDIYAVPSSQDNDSPVQIFADVIISENDTSWQKTTQSVHFADIEKPYVDIYTLDENIVYDNKGTHVIKLYIPKGYRVT